MVSERVWTEGKRVSPKNQVEACLWLMESLPGAKLESTLLKGHLSGDGVNASSYYINVQDYLDSILPDFPAPRGVIGDTVTSAWDDNSNWYLYDDILQERIAAQEVGKVPVEMIPDPIPEESPTPSFFDKLKARLRWRK